MKSNLWPFHKPRTHVLCSQTSTTRISWTPFMCWSIRRLMKTCNLLCPLINLIKLLIEFLWRCVNHMNLFIWRVMNLMNFVHELSSFDDSWNTWTEFMWQFMNRVHETIHEPHELRSWTEFMWQFMNFVIDFDPKKWMWEFMWKFIDLLMYFCWKMSEILITE